MIAVIVFVSLQAVDLLTTWIGINLPNVHECDGTAFAHLLLIKVAMTVVFMDVTYKRKLAAWIGCSAFAAIMLPIIINNLILITRAH